MLSKIWAILRWAASHRFWGGALALVLLAFVAGADAFAGRQIAFSFFYVGPILLATWAGGRRTGMLFATLAVLIYIGTDIASYSRPATWVAIWNFAVRGGTLVTIALLAATLRASLDKERDRARIDDTTGIPNSRTFRERLRLECARKARKNRPMTLLYMDLDDFKGVNDTFGHSAGDEVLKAVGRILKSTTRTVDMVGRLGGDEFAILLPDTDERGAEAVIKRLRHVVDAEQSLQRAIAFSLGVATFHHAHLEVDEALSAADALMYKAKHKGPNRVARASYLEPPNVDQDSVVPAPLTRPSRTVPLDSLHGGRV